MRFHLTEAEIQLRFHRFDVVSLAHHVADVQVPHEVLFCDVSFYNRKKLREVFPSYFINYLEKGKFLQRLILDIVEELGWQNMDQLVVDPRRPYLILLGVLLATF